MSMLRIARDAATRYPAKAEIVAKFDNACRPRLPLEMRHRLPPIPQENYPKLCHSLFKLRNGSGKRFPEKEAMHQK
jgi:hypothetical protein